jgi:PRTRC genetic system protein A
MSQPVGYFINHPVFKTDIHGTCYDYIMGSNGLFLEAENNFFKVRIPVAWCLVRGLNEVSTEVVLKCGKIPASLFELAMSNALIDLQKEAYYAITWKEGSYHLFKTQQHGEFNRLSYNTIPNTVMDLHSHPTFAPEFSDADNKDDQGLRISAIMGNLHQTPCHVIIRLGVYGYFLEMRWEDIFEGLLPSGVIDVYQRTQEVVSELSSPSTCQQGGPDRGRWNWLTRFRKPVPIVNR